MVVTESTYQLQYIPLANRHNSLAYNLDFCVSLYLREVIHPGLLAETKTCIQWELTTSIQTELPLVLRTMPGVLLQRAGTQLLDKIVRQVTQQLTARITADFISRYLPSELCLQHGQL